MTEDIPKIIEIQIPITLKEVLKKWSLQVGTFKDETSPEEREKLYMNALMSLFVEFTLSHEKFSDENFVRIFRFFKDMGFSKRVSKEAPVYERYEKLDLQIA